MIPVVILGSLALGLIISVIHCLLLEKDTFRVIKACRCLTYTRHLSCNMPVVRDSFPRLNAITPACIFVHNRPSLPTTPPMYEQHSARYRLYVSEHAGRSSSIHLVLFVTSLCFYADITRSNRSLLVVSFMFIFLLKDCYLYIRSIVSRTSNSTGRTSGIRLPKYT